MDERLLIADLLLYNSYASKLQYCLIASFLRAVSPYMEGPILGSHIKRIIGFFIIMAIYMDGKILSILWPYRGVHVNMSLKVYCMHLLYKSRVREDVRTFTRRCVNWLVYKAQPSNI